MSEEQTTATVEANENQQGQGEEVKQEEAEKVEMTKEEYEAELQKESDRRVTQAIKKREQEFKKELEKEKEEARKEAEELAKLSEEEKLKAEKEREEMKITKEREELNKERSEFERERLQLQAEKELASRKLPTEFAPYILGEDADDTFERITTFEEQWQNAIQSEIEERLKSKTPKLGARKQSHFTKEQVAGMSQEEVAANMAEIEESMKLW